MARRARGEGSVYKVERIRKDGSKKIFWRAEITLANADRHHTRKYKFFDAPTQGEAIAKRDLWKLENFASAFVQPTERTVKTYLTSWFASKRNLKDSTVAVSEVYLNSYIFPYIGGIKLQELKSEQLNDMFNALQRTGGKKKTGLASATLRKVHFMLFSALEKAVEDEILVKNPLHKLEIPKAVKAKIKPLNADEIKLIFSDAKTDPLFPAVALAISTGIRRGELLALTWDDVNLNEGVISINKQLIPIKGGTATTSLKTERSNRPVGIPQKVIEILKQEKAKQESSEREYNENKVICQENGKHYHPRNFQKRFDKFLDELGIEKRRVHDMRHTFATHLLSNGSYVNEVQNALGHTDAKTTLSVYGHILPGRQKELANKMNKILPK